MGTSGQHDPGRFKVGDPITHQFLNQVVDALVQRITIPGGLVTRVGQAVVLDPNPGGGGVGGQGFVGLVTARYGSFVNVSQVDGNVTDLQQKTPPVVITYVWCMTAFHPWLPLTVNPLNPPNDIVWCLPAPSGLTFDDPAASGPDATFPINWMAVGTVPEADLNLFMGGDPGCFFSPFDTGCTLTGVTADPWPPGV